MVLRPILNSNPNLRTSPPRSCASAWDLVSQLQREPASEYWLIPQAGHAELSGLLAASFRSPLLPPVSREVVEAIAAHDAGWASREQNAGKPVILLCGDGRPASFLDATPEEFVKAWLESIEHAAGLSPLGGLLVSHHFSRLGQHRLNLQTDSPAATTLLREFLEDEGRRQKRLLAESGNSAGISGQGLDSEVAALSPEIEALIDLLQFCDLLSLYLCSGARHAAEFPQQFRGRTIRIVPQPEGPAGKDIYALEPSLFSPDQRAAKTSPGRRFSVPATHFPLRGKDPELEKLSFTVR